MIHHDLTNISRAAAEAVRDGRVTDDLVATIADQVGEMALRVRFLEGALLAPGPLPAGVADLTAIRAALPFRRRLPAPSTGGDAA